MPLTISTDGIISVEATEIKAIRSNTLDFEPASVYDKQLPGKPTLLGRCFMPRGMQVRFTLIAAMIGICAVSWEAYAQSDAPTNDAPNPYRTMEGWAKLPGREKVGIDERSGHR